MEQVCYDGADRHQRARRTRLARREGARARRRVAASATPCSRRSAPSPPSSCTPAARSTPSGARTPRTSSTFGREVDAGISGHHAARVHAARAAATTRTCSPPSSGSSRARAPATRPRWSRDCCSAGHLDWFWHIRGSTSPRATWWTRCSRSPPTTPRAEGRALALLANGMISTMTGEWERSIAESQAAARRGSHARRHGDHGRGDDVRRLLPSPAADAWTRRAPRSTRRSPRATAA